MADIFVNGEPLRASRAYYDGIDRDIMADYHHAIGNRYGLV